MCKMIRSEPNQTSSVWKKKGGDDKIVMLKKKENRFHGTVSKAVSVSPFVVSVFTGFLHSSTKIPYKDRTLFLWLLINSLMSNLFCIYFVDHSFFDWIHEHSLNATPILCVSNNAVVCCSVCQVRLLMVDG